jgi:hypothetical protein
MKKAKRRSTPTARTKPTTARQRTEERLQVLAIELGMAGIEALVHDYGWSVEAANAWLEKTLARARANRAPARATQGDTGNASDSE